ncbi:MAG: GGDEF domain-containing protein [Peptococcaceae bacterium]|nr:GGDEF domain-containing protein [Peptococcaceae bacterium]
MLSIIPPIEDIERTIIILLPQVIQVTGSKTAIAALEKNPEIKIGGYLNDCEPKVYSLYDSDIYEFLSDIKNPVELNDSVERFKKIVNNFGIESGILVPILNKELYGQIVINANRVEMAWVKLGMALAQGFANAKQYQWLKIQACTDELTGLFNSRGFYEKLREEMERAQRYCANLTLVYYDIDCFKEINDIIGHVDADKVLAEIGHIIKTSIRSSDVASRLGGDEFAVCFVNTTKQVGWMVSNRLRGKIESARYPLLERAGIELKVSAGISNFPEDGVKMEDILRAADINMYQDKRTKKSSKLF